MNLEAYFSNQVIPALKDNKIFLYYNEPLLNEHVEEVKEIFLSKVLSFIQPIFLHADTSFNFLPENNQSYIVVTLKDNQKDHIHHVIINIPSKKLQRFYTLQMLNDMQYVVFIDDIVRENLGIIFPGQQIVSLFSIKLNRDAELKLNDEYSSGLLEKLEKQLATRETAEASRLLYEKGMPLNMRLFLASIFGINLSDMFEGGRYHNLSDLFNFPSFDASLYYKKDVPILYPSSASGGDIFNFISAKDILLHLPYHSYVPVLSFFNQAAVDTDVTEIYITLYRVAAESHIVNALISAAKNGKKVTAIIELKARFDEANNIKWSRVMKDAGVKLIYSEAAIKVHSKIALVKRKTADGPVSYAILSTGNFNENTASFYTDHVLMTVDKKITRELIRLFDFLSKSKVAAGKSQMKFNELFVSQFNLVDKFESLVKQEIKKVKKGKPALIRIKVNNLEEPGMIKLLYDASAAGVEIQLIVRSVCCLVPGLTGLSERITVKRIVDKYLEHTRIFIFGTGNDNTILMGSADLMTRNLYKRIEVCMPIKDDTCRQQLLDYFSIQWNDNRKAEILLSNMDTQRPVDVIPQHRAQLDIFEYLKN